MVAHDVHCCILTRSTKQRKRLPQINVSRSYVVNKDMIGISKSDGSLDLIHKKIFHRKYKQLQVDVQTSRILKHTCS